MSAPVNHYLIVKRAVTGDHDAWRELYALVVESIRTGEPADFSTAISEGLIIARMAALAGVAGGWAFVLQLLVVADARASELDFDTDGLKAESIAIMAMLADHGTPVDHQEFEGRPFGEVIPDWLNLTASEVSPAIMARSQEIQAMLREAETRP